jgi:CheY-like chemotaxis protein
MSAPKLNVAVFSQQARELRVAGIVLAHIKGGKYQFTLVDKESAQTIHIALVDRSDEHMWAQARALREAQPTLGLIHLVNAAGNSGEPFELLPGQMMAHLITVLEKVADTVSAKASRAERAVNSNVVPLGRAAQKHQLRALIVDDSPTVRTQLGNVVARIGMQHDSVESAAAALARLAGTRYDVIYVDVVMPDMDGYKLTREIKRNPHHKSTPVVILTSQSSPFDRARGALAGCDLFLTKPVAVKAFFDATAKALRKTMAVDDLSAWITDPTLPAKPPAPPAFEPARPPQWPRTTVGSLGP